MGWKLALRTFLAVLLVSLLSKLTASSAEMGHLDPIFAAVTGGAITGIGLLILFRHQASLGGINILALCLQDRHNVRAGYVQLAPTR